MFYILAGLLKPYWSIFNVVHYTSFRAMSALLSSLFLSFLYGPWFIGRSRQLFRSKSRDWTPERHKQKDGMPTMGGLFICAVVILNCLLWCNVVKAQVWVFLGCIAGFGAIGLWDDWSKLKRGKGIRAGQKAFIQLIMAFFIMVGILFMGTSTSLTMPFIKHWNPDMGRVLFVAWGMFVLVGASNAVNLTDGLDGLAIGSLIPNFCTFALVSFLAGHAKVAAYLHIPYAASAEGTIIGASLVGASLGFLWFNAYPAQIFMGDVGSLALGAALAFLALVAKQELLLVCAGGLFVVEALSVITQVFSFKYLGRRIFRMAPLHHHFELLGWPEALITMRFAIITVVLCLIALMTLKLR